MSSNNDIEHINQLQEEVTEEFSMLEDWMDKYDHLIGLGKELPLINPGEKKDEYLIRGCQSQVWLNASLKDGKVFYAADSDARQ